MRRLKLQISMTLDGYMAGPNGELDWMTQPWSDDIAAYIKSSGLVMEPVDCIVLGRKCAEDFIPAWAAGPEGVPQEAVDWMNGTPRVVISNTLTESPWDNAIIANGDPAETVSKLKAEPGGDMIAYGGSRLVSSLIAKELVDELHLLVDPTSIGVGLPVFPDLGSHQRFRPVNMQPFECGITALHLEPKRS